MKTQTTIIDVRTREEFRGGHVAGSINIPLLELQSQIEEIRKIKNTIVVCCASGARSEQAVRFLNGYGIACENGGSWTQVNNNNR